MKHTQWEIVASNSHSTLQHNVPVSKEDCEVNDVAMHWNRISEDTKPFSNQISVALLPLVMAPAMSTQRQRNKKSVSRIAPTVPQSLHPPHIRFISQESLQKYQCIIQTELESHMPMLSWSIKQSFAVTFWKVNKRMLINKKGLIAYSWRKYWKKKRKNTKLGALHINSLLLFYLYSKLKASSCTQA